MLLLLLIGDLTDSQHKGQPTKGWLGGGEGDILHREKSWTTIGSR